MARKAVRHVVSTRGFSHHITPQNQAGSSKPPRRKRRPLSAGWQPDTQPQCTFLSKVPGEIRNIVYLLVLGNRNLCLYDCRTVASKQRLTHHEVYGTEHGHSHGSTHPRCNKLALLQTCRQLYSEASAILYSTNRFQLGTLHSIKAFNQFVEAASPSRLAYISSLKISCEVDCFEPGHPLASKMFKRWRKMWNAVVEQMSGLRHLTLLLQNTGSLVDGYIQLSADSYWVKPFLRIRNLDTFSVTTFRSRNFEAPVIVQSSLFPQHEDIEDKIERLRQHCQQLLCSPR